VTRRWLIVLVTAAVLVLTPVAVAARPARGSNISAVDLAQRIQVSRAVSWSGFVESSGALKVPDSDSFANLSQLLGENNELRVWWRSPEQWRVDRIRSTGETDLFRNGQTSVRWVFESEQATIAPVSMIRLPDASDLLPPTLGRQLLQGVRPDELTRLPARRVAGIDAPGLRLTPHDDASTVDHVDLWVDLATGLPLRIELYGIGDRRPVLSTELVALDRATPDLSITTFVRAQGVDVEYENSVDVAAAANALARSDLPATLGGLPARRGVDPGAVGDYGRGPTTLFALPLRGQVAGPLRQRLRDSSAVQETVAGTFLPVGPIGLLVTPRRLGGSFLLAGTVTPQTLQRAASELLATT
jgi:hypothetical protein